MNGRQFGAPEPRPASEGVSAPPRTAATPGGSSETTRPFEASKETNTAALRAALTTARPHDRTRRRDSAPGERAVRTGSHHMVTIAIWVALALALLVAAWLWGGRLFGGGLVGVDKGGYQAVFLTNNQTYFGKLQAASDGYLKLSDVYYLNSQPATADTTTGTNDPAKPDTNVTNQGNLQLFKMTDAAVIGPDDTMYISAKQVLLYENLKPDSKVVQSIAKYQQAH